MKKENKSFGILALASLLFTMAFSYLWASVGSGELQLFAYGALLFGAVFTYAAAKCLLAVERKEEEKKLVEAARN